MKIRKMLNAALLCATIGLVSVSWSQNPLAKILLVSKDDEDAAVKLLEEKAFSHGDRADHLRIAAAIEALRYSKLDTSAPVLIHYFDFPRELAGGGVVGSSRIHLSAYPAVEIFMEHGTAALPLLKTAIQSDQSSPLVRENASVAIGWILQLDFPKLAEYLEKEGDAAGPVTGRNFHEVAAQMRAPAAKGQPGPLDVYRLQGRAIEYMPLK